MRSGSICVNSREAVLMLAGKQAASVCVLLALTASVLAQPSADRGAPWMHHSIDDSSRGADGVRLADANGDGLLDIATGWEEGGVIRLYLNPGPKHAAQRWPAVTVARVK